jgi:N-acetyl-anhydromuramyl-L-alanine amidase AmpD
MNRFIKDIIIHCSATKNLKDVKAETIDKGHKKRGFRRNPKELKRFNPTLESIGYHYILEVDGNIATGRGLEEMGAHVFGSNEYSIGICMIGTDNFEPIQWANLKLLLIQLASELSRQNISNFKSAIATFKRLNISVKGHRDHSPDLDGDGIVERTEWLKICPGFDVGDWIRKNTL